MEDLAFYNQGYKALCLLITILASVVMNRLLSRGPLGIGSVPVCVLCVVWRVVCVCVCLSVSLSICLCLCVSVCALVCVPSWPSVIFRVVTLHLGEGGLGLLGSAKVQILDSSV